MPTDALGEIGSHFRDTWLQSLLGCGAELFVFPPRLGDMMVRKDLVLADNKSRAEIVFAHFRGAALETVDYVAVAILERLAVWIDRAVPQRPP